MPKIINLIGQTFGRLTVIKRGNNNKYNRSTWLCQCNCGIIKIINSNSLIIGRTKSCGCLHKEGNRLKHGHDIKGKVSTTYSAWVGMKGRCLNVNNRAYKDYGGRGITVCKRWLKFENFLKDMGESPGKGYSLDRIENNKGYYPKNCRWATHKEQCRNRRNNHTINYSGRTRCLMDWAKELNIAYDLLRARIYKYMWPIEKAFTIPKRIHK